MLVHLWHFDQLLTQKHITHCPAMNVSSAELGRKQPYLKLHVPPEHDDAEEGVCILSSHQQDDLFAMLFGIPNSRNIV